MPRVPSPEPHKKLSMDHVVQHLHFNKMVFSTFCPDFIQDKIVGEEILLLGGVTRKALKRIFQKKDLSTDFKKFKHSHLIK